MSDLLSMRTESLAGPPRRALGYTGRHRASGPAGHLPVQPGDGDCIPAAQLSAIRLLSAPVRPALSAPLHWTTAVRGGVKPGPVPPGLRVPPADRLSALRAEAECRPPAATAPPSRGRTALWPPVTYPPGPAAEPPFVYGSCAAAGGPTTSRTGGQRSGSGPFRARRASAGSGPHLSQRRHLPVLPASPGRLPRLRPVSSPARTLPAPAPCLRPGPASYSPLPRRSPSSRTLRPPSARTPGRAGPTCPGCGPTGSASRRPAADRDPAGGLARSRP